jgi:hypothetical protein
MSLIIFKVFWDTQKIIKSMPLNRNRTNIFSLHYNLYCCVTNPQVGSHVKKTSI